MIFVSFCIPAYNEQDNIEGIIIECAQFANSHNISYEIIVIDDKSTDNTHQIIRKTGESIPHLKIERNHINLGCHPSVVKAFNLAIGEWLVFLPADKQIKPDILGLAIPYMNDYDIIATKRINRADHIIRRLISTCYNILIKMVTGVFLNDFDSSIILRNKTFKEISNQLNEKTASLSIEIILRCTANGARLKEIEIAHYPRTAGTAHGLNIRDAAEVPKSLIRMYKLRRRLQKS